MRKRFTTALLAGAMMVAPFLTPEAHASHDWFAIGTAFRVGAAHISFVFGQSYGYGPSYYYRYDRPIRYRDHHCSRYCFHDAGYYYHHESCPLVAFHFSTYRVDPYWAYSRYAPRYDGYGYGGYGGGYGGYGSYGGHYDRGYYDRGYYDRYDGRGRYDDHRGYYDRRGHYDRNRGYDRHDRHDSHRGDRDHRGRGRGHQHHRGCGHY
jgi:hypothetical protein